MSKHILIAITERNVHQPQYFDSLELAQAQMEKELLEEIGAYEYRIDREDYGIDSHDAWANTHHINSDWAIFEVPDE
jgi:hypothetical protein